MSFQDLCKKQWTFLRTDKRGRLAGLVVSGRTVTVTNAGSDHRTKHEIVHLGVSDNRYQGGEGDIPKMYFVQ